MLIKIWHESTVFEKIRVTIVMTVFSIVISFIAMRFLHQSYLHDSDMVEACSKYGAKYTQKFLIIEGEASPICER